MNQPTPNEAESDFDDVETMPSRQAAVPVTRVRERRYQFFGRPESLVNDGHCVNFLEYAGRLYLYDASFGLGPVEIEAPLPVPDDLTAVGGADLAPFRKAYLDDAVDFMLGSLYNGNTLHPCDEPRTGVFDGNGLTVRTKAIPDTIDGEDGLTFFWSE